MILATSATWCSSCRNSDVSPLTMSWSQGWRGSSAICWRRCPGVKRKKSLSISNAQGRILLSHRRWETAKKQNLSHWKRKAPYGQKRFFTSAPTFLTVSRQHLYCLASESKGGQLCHKGYQSVPVMKAKCLISSTPKNGASHACWSGRWEEAWAQCAGEQGTKEGVPSRRAIPWAGNQRTGAWAIRWAIAEKVVHHDLRMAGPSCTGWVRKGEVKTNRRTLMAAMTIISRPARGSNQLV